MNTRGYIQLHRKLTDHWLWDEVRVFSRAEAWIDLLLQAQWGDGNTLWTGSVVPLKRGEILTSQTRLMKKWRWSNSKVRGFLDTLCDENMIDVFPMKKYTRIKILAYGDYQLQRKETVFS